MKGWYLHKQRASLQKRKISGACKIQSRLGGKKKKKSKKKKMAQRELQPPR